MKTPLWFSIGVFSLVPSLFVSRVTILPSFSWWIGAYYFSIFAKEYVAILFVKAQLPYGVLKGRRKRWNSLIVLGDNSMPDSGLASCVVDYNNLGVAKLFQMVHYNRVFLVVLYDITSFHIRCQPGEHHLVYASGVTCQE